MRPRGHAGVTLAGALLALLSLATPAGALTISGLGVALNLGNSANLWDDVGVLGQEIASQATILASTLTQFETRYAFQLGIDAGGAGAATSSLAFTADYTISFTVNVVPTKTWTLDIETDRIGALTLVNDGSGRARARLFGVTGSATGATLGGSLDLASAGSIDVATGANIPFSQTGVATVTGTGTQNVTLRFVFLGDVRTQVSGIQGDEAAIRMGMGSNLGSFSAGDYPGVGARTMADDGHFVRVSYNATPEPGTFTAVTLGLAGLGFVGRNRSAERRARASVV